MGKAAKGLVRSRPLDLDEKPSRDNVNCLISVIKRASLKQFPRAAIHNNELVM